jgi:hypothetical protein
MATWSGKKPKKLRDASTEDEQEAEELYNVTRPPAAEKRIPAHRNHLLT